MTRSKLFFLVPALCLLAGIVPAQAQVAGSTLIGVAAAELRSVALGWSAKHQVIGHQVVSDKAEYLGSVDDIIVSPDKAVTYLIVNAGNLVLKHDVAIAATSFKLVGTQLTLPGATRDRLKASPVFEYK